MKAAKQPGNQTCVDDSTRSDIHSVGNLSDREFARVARRISDGASIPLRPRGYCLEERNHVGLTLRVKLCGRGLRAEADAAHRLPHMSRRAAGGVPPPALVS